MADWHPIYVAVRAAFQADTAGTTISDLAPSTAWFADQAPDRRPDDGLFLVYRLISPMPHNRLASGDNLDAELQVDVYGERNDEADVKSLADAAYRLLDRVTLSVTGFENVRTLGIRKPSPFKEHPYFRLMSQFRLFGSAA